MRLMSALCLLLAPAPALAAHRPAALTPAQALAKDLVDTNKAYSTTPHAMLKIQDAAYLSEGQSASLMGAAGQPGSFRWKPGAATGAQAVATYRGGKLQLLVHGKPAARPMANDTPIAPNISISPQLTQVAAGQTGARIFVYNQQAEAAKAFKGVSWFPYDPAYVISARFTPDPKRPPHVFRTSRGTDKQFYRVGEATFTLGGKPQRLDLYADSQTPGEIKAMSTFFMDGLTGSVTYGAGRFLDADHFGAYPPKAVKLDFNNAYNPNCARSPFYTCPVPQDRLDVPVRAGEKAPPPH